MHPTLEDQIAIARHHFEQKGYRVHSGLQFGCELVLYADSPGRVHSDFCVLVVGPNETLDWRRIQTLVRSMPGLHKTLIVANVKPIVSQESEKSSTNDQENPAADKSMESDHDFHFSKYTIDELAIASEHAPFRHKNAPKGVGQQIKPSKN